MAYKYGYPMVRSLHRCADCGKRLSKVNRLVNLKLSSTGRYSCEDIEIVPEEVCKNVKQLDNQAVKVYEKLHEKLPEGISPAGWRLLMKVKENK